MGRQKRKSRVVENTSCFSLKTKKDSTGLKPKRKKRKPPNRLKGEKMAEELANADKHFAIIEREMLPEDHESVLKCENGKIPKVEDTKTVTGDDIDDAIENIASL